MSIESAGFIDELVATNPTGSDDYSTADDHLRLIKAVLQAQFPNLDEAMIATAKELNAIVALVHKTTSQAKNNDDVLADDTHLAGIVLANASQYRFEAHLDVAFANVTNGGIQLQLQFSDTPQRSDMIATAGFATTFVHTQGDAGMLLSYTGSTVKRGIHLSGTFLSAASGAGTLDLQWAQAVSNAQLTTLEVTSYLRVVKIS